MTTDMVLKKQIADSDSILKYISRVLMEDDAFEDLVPTINDSKLDATKRSFHDIILGKKPRDEEGDDAVGARNCKYLMEEDESSIRELFSKMAIRYCKNDKFTLMAHYAGNAALPKQIVCKREGIDLRNLLLQCMQSVAISDHDNVNKLLEEIRSRASANGDGTQRLAYYFSEGIEVRLLGSKIPQHTTLAVKVFSDNDFMKAFKVYLTAFPFSETSYSFVNETIMELAEKATSLHIINFAIMHGLQWSKFIQLLSERPGGPPNLRITAVDFPLTGFHPDARAKNTGRRLASYCTEYNVPFKYDSIVKNWEDVELKDIMIEKGETLVVYCMPQFMYVREDTILEPSPRDKVLRLIQSINPDIFIHLIVNGAYNSPFFASRFREALFQYSTWFDMFDVNLPRDSPERFVYEKEFWRKEILNIIASEGSERVERPETYRQWQNRTVRAGFKPIPLNPNTLRKIRTRVKSCYHKDFFVDEAGPWLIDGWKGRPLFGASCWKPIK